VPPAPAPNTGPGQIHVDWDNGRSLILIDTDPYQVISAARPERTDTGANPVEDMLAWLRALRAEVDHENNTYRLAVGDDGVEPASDCADHHDRLADLHRDIADLVAALDEHLSTGGQLPRAWATATQTADPGNPATVPARALRVGQCLDNGKHVRAVSGSGGVVDVVFSDGTVWCSVPENHPITLWDGRPSTRVYPFAYLPHDEHQVHCPHQPH
jgi:hypothetical protein